MMRALTLAGLLIGLIAACVIPSGARAQDPRYNALVTEGLSEFEAGRWVEAYNLFKQAHAAFPNARTLRGMGMTSYEMRKYPRALRQLRAALSSDDKPLTSQQQAHVQDFIDRAARLVGTIEVVLTPPGATLSINLRQTDSHKAVVPVGEVKIRAAFPGYQTTERILTVDGGQVYQVVLTLPPLAGTSVDATPVPGLTQPVDLKLTPADTTASPSDDSSTGGVWLWVGVGAAVAGGIVAALLVAASDDPGDRLPASNAGVEIQLLEDN